MRTTFLAICFLFFSWTASAQETWRDTTHRHELGVDVTAFLRQFLDWGGSSDGMVSNYYEPLYWATYRYHFKHGNIRFAVGGNLANNENPGLGGNTDVSHVKSSEFDLSVGVERVEELSKRWQAYYGLDFRPAWTYQYDDYLYSSGYYQYGLEERGTYLAVAPLIGIRYRIAKRLSILTEASLSFVSSNIDRRDFSKPQDDMHSEMPDLDQTAKSFAMKFATPLSVVVTFDL